MPKWNPKWKNNYVFQKKLDAYKQRGQTCGIYALEAALKGHGLKPPPATYGEKQKISKDLRTIIKNLANSSGNFLSLRHQAKKETLTKVGELFDVKDVKKLGHRFKKDIAIKNFTDGKDLENIVIDEINDNRLIMIAFQPKNPSGLPTSGKGENAHWCVIFGYSRKTSFKRAGKTMLAVHGWGEYYELNSKELYKSNKSLHKFKDSDWYKYTGTDRNIFSMLNGVCTMGIKTLGPMYMSKEDLKKVISWVYNPKKQSKRFNSEIKKLKKIHIPGVDLKAGLSKKLIVI